MKAKVSALQIKCALMEYFRFVRQWLCVDEARGADILVDTGSETHEVEVKISKYDLTVLEPKKHKHQKYCNQSDFLHNKFSICVPTAMIEVARKWVEEMDSRYGLIEYNPDGGMFAITIVKSAKSLHNSYDTLRTKVVYMRLCSSLIGYMKRHINREGVIK